MAVTFNGEQLENATFNGELVDKITLDGEIIWESSYTLSFAKSGIGVGTLPAPVKVKKGTTVSVHAYSGAGNSNASVSYIPSDGSDTVTLSIPVENIAKGTEDFGTYYYDYEWNTKDFIINANTTITLTGTEKTRVYTVEFRADTGLYLNSSGTSTITVSQLSPNATVTAVYSATDNTASCAIVEDNQIKAIATVERYADSTPNRFGFSHWSEEYNGALSDIMKDNGSNTLTITAWSKNVWPQVWSGSVKAITDLGAGATQTVVINGLTGLSPSKPAFGSFIIGKGIVRDASCYVGQSASTSDNDRVTFNSVNSSASITATFTSGASLSTTKRNCYVEAIYQP